MGSRDKLRTKSLYGVEGGKSRTPSKAYHGFFEGYKEQYVLNANGKARIERVYTAEYYKKNLSAKGCVGVKILYVGLFLLAVAAHVFAASRPILMTYTWFVALPQALFVPVAILVAFHLVFYLLAPHDMTISDFKTSSKLKKTALAMSMCAAVSIIAELIYLVFNFSEDPNVVTLCIACDLVAAAAAMAVWGVERKIEYIEVENSAKSTKHGEMID